MLVVFQCFEEKTTPLVISAVVKDFYNERNQKIRIRTNPNPDL